MNDKHSFLVRYSQILENEIKKYGLSKGWDMSSIQSRVVDGEIKVYPGQKRYLKFVDKGTKPFLMYALQGKVIPINDSFDMLPMLGCLGTRITTTTVSLIGAGETKSGGILESGLRTL